MKKYRPLSDFLVKQYDTTISLTFKEVEKILGFALPPSAYSHRAWWANSPSHPQASSWLNVGWKVNDVDLKKKMASFHRPLVLCINEITANDKELSLKVSINSENVKFILSGPNASASAGYSWRQIVQMLIDANPHLFGHLTHQPDHYIFAEMLALLNYTVVNWETGESWKAIEEGEKPYSFRSTLI
jgi:hypothetical protein